jgi:drug/metabolite transporter (DMT)-like permease
MIYLLLTVLATSGMILMFKVFEVFKINTLQGLFFNYITAAIWCNFMADSGNVAGTSFWLHPWFPYTCLLGVMFIAIFYATAVTAQKIAVSVSIVAGKMSLVLTVLFISYYFGEDISLIKWVGIIGALAAVYLTTRREEKARISGVGAIIFPLLVFVGSALVDSSLKMLEHKYFKNGDVNEQLAITFSAAFVTGFSIWLFRKITNRGVDNQVTWRALLGGASLGTLNYIATFTLIKTLNEGLMPGSAVFPVMNISVVAVTSIAAVFLFKERLSKLNITGIILSMLFIAIIAFDHQIITIFSR